MLKPYRLYQVDAFTKQRFKGNPAGVLPEAEGLSDADMQHIARELNNSETAFVFPSDQDGYDLHVRFFTPKKEVPSCGHATIAAHYVRALELGLGACRVTQKTGAGILPIDIVREDEDYRIIMTQGKIEFGALLGEGERNVLLSALHISGEDLLARCPVQIVSTGHSKVMVGIASTALLHRLRPDFEALSRLSETIGCNGYYVFTLGESGRDVLVNGRMFAPAIGIYEDPVTGNANGPLGAYLVHYGLAEHDGELFRFRARQGEAMGREGTIEVQVPIQDGEPTEVRVAGDAVIAFKTEVLVDVPQAPAPAQGTRLS